jgi:hypothetical protein
LAGRLHYNWPTSLGAEFYGAGIVEDFSMALVERFQKVNMQRNTVHGPVDCSYSTFVEGGEKFIQLDTYGSQGREISGKKSQTIQLSQNAAKKLIKILSSEFL